MNIGLAVLVRRFGASPLQTVCRAGAIVPAVIAFSIIVILVTAVHPFARVSSTLIFSPLFRSLKVAVAEAEFWNSPPADLMNL